MGSEAVLVAGGEDRVDLHLGQGPGRVGGSRAPVLEPCLTFGLVPAEPLPGRLAADLDHVRRMSHGHPVDKDSIDQQPPAEDRQLRTTTCHESLPDPRSVGLREGEVDEEVGLGLGQQVGDRRKRSCRPSTTRRSWARADASSGCSKIERMTVAIMLRAERGTRSWALRVQWTRQRCQATPRSCSWTALTEPR